MSRNFLYIVSTLVHAIVAWRLVPDLWGWPVYAVAVAVLLAVSAVVMPLGLLASRTREDDTLAWVGMLLMGLFSSLFVLTVLRDIALAFVGIAMHFGYSPRFALLPDSAALVPPLALLVTAIGFLNARRTAAVVRVDVPVDGLPAGLEGFTIAQISDIHVGPTIKAPYLQAIVDRVNSLDADAVAITGDLVDGSVAKLGPHVAPLAGLKSRHGSYFVTGNHEYYSGAQSWIGELRRIGVNVLMNQHVLLPRNGEQLVLAGVNDATAHHFDASHASDPALALAGAPASAGARVLLAHQPRAADAAEKAGFDVQLSGHTHGGQFWPWGYFVRLQQPFTAGLHRLGRLWVYTSRGTGYWGPPKRFGAPSEITLVRLVKA